MATKTRVVISGAASISTLGMTNAALIANLLTQQSNLIEKPFEIGGVWVSNIGLCERNHPALKELADKRGGSFFSNALIYLIKKALEDAQINDCRFDKPLDLLLGSTFGNKPDYFQMLESMRTYKTTGNEDVEERNWISNTLEDIGNLNFREDRLTQELEQGLALHLHKHSLQAQCAAGILAVIEAMELIRSGSCKMAIAGAYDFFDAIVYRYMKENRLVSEGPSLPFDRDNKGMSFADGAGMLVLEEYEYAKRRGVQKFYGELEGYGIITSPDTEPGPTIKGIVKAIDMAVSRAGLAKEDIHLISAHGNANPLMDRKELFAYTQYFSEAIHTLPIVSYVANLGYSLAGSGIIDLIIASNCMANNRLIGTISPRHSDKGCKLNFAYGKNVTRNIERYMKLKVNITGTAASLIVSKVHEHTG